MAKKYYEGTDYTFNTDWGKEETTGLPLSGGAVQQVIKDKVAEIEASLGRKVGYIYENNQSSMFEFWTSEYDYRNNTKGCKIGETPKVKAYGMEKYMGPNNQTVFISSNKNKIFTWGYKTFDNQSKVAFPEKATVNFTITSGGSPKPSTTIVGTHNADEIIDDFCVFNTNLDDRLDEGVNEIKINITGETTKVEVSIEYTITVVNFDLKDTTQFEGTNKNSLSLLPEIVCTNGQDYFVEYKLNDGEYVIGRNDTGNGNKQTPSISVNLSDLNDGKHICEYRGGILINGKHHYSKTQRIEFVKNNDGLIDKPQVLIFSEYIDGDKITENDGNLIINNIQQYIPYSVKYSVYTPDGRNANVMFKNKLDGSEFNINTDSSKAYTFDGQIIEYGIIPFDIFVNEEFNRTIYLNVGDSGLNIKFHNTNLRIDFSSVNKNNNSDEKEEWISQITENGVVRYHNKVTFNDTFDWSQGWTKDGLVIGENSVATFDYCPFPKQEFDVDNDVKEEWVGGSIDGSGIVRPYTFEIEFKTQNISDENVVLCDLMREDGKKTGIRITGNLFEFYVSENEKVSCRFKEGEMNRIAVVIRPQYSKDKDGKEVFKGLVELYVNGVISGIAKFTTEDELQVIDENMNSKALSFAGHKDAEIVIKYIRAYRYALLGNNVLNNYILSRTDINELLSLYEDNNILNSENKITPETILAWGKIPVLIFVGRTNDNIAYGDGNEGDKKGNLKPGEVYVQGEKNKNDDYVWTTLEEETNKGREIEMDVIYVNPLNESKNFKLIKACIRPQGTSSMYYPKKNYRIYTQKRDDTRVFLSGGQKGDAGNLRYSDMINWHFGEDVYMTDAEGNEIFKDGSDERKWECWRGQKNKKKRLYSFKDAEDGNKAAQPVKCWCLKADFAETSSSHNTGIARLWNETLMNAQIDNVNIFRTNAQELAHKINYKYDVRTTVDGFPIVVFACSSYDSKEFTFLGKYNFNNDKSTESVFGFCDIDDSNEFSCDAKETLSSLSEDIENGAYDAQYGEKVQKKYNLNEMLEKYMCCVETLDNGHALANYATLNDWDTEDNEGKKEWEKAFEFRYPEIPEKPKEKDYKTGDKWGGVEGDENDYWEAMEEYEENILNWNNRNLKPFKHFAEWVVSTRWCDVDGNILPGISPEEAKKRKERFNEEKWNHLDVWKMAAYYVYVMRFGAVDQIVKNSMLTSEGPLSYNENLQKIGHWDNTDENDPNYGRFYKWYYINYDNDTIMGVKNNGALVHGPEITRQSQEEGNEDVKAYAGWDSTLWNNFEQDSEFMDIVKKVDRAISSVMSYKKTLEMFEEKQVNQWCERIYNYDAEYKYIGPYVGDWTYKDLATNTDAVDYKDKLFMLQGSRTAHRRWWLSKRFSLLDGKWNSGEFSQKFIEVKSDYSQKGDTFKIVPGSNAYFGYKINQNTFGDGPLGAVQEYKTNETVNWVLGKVINIGDPISIYGACDIKELNLQGIAKNLNSISPTFGGSENKLEILNVSIPQDELVQGSYYDVNADDANKVGSGYEKFIKKYPEITEDKFGPDKEYMEYEEDNAPDFNASDSESPDFYRIIIRDEESKEIITYTYFAKIVGSNGIRNKSFGGFDYSVVKNLQELYVAGHTKFTTIDLTGNLFITTVDAGYSNVSRIDFAPGCRIKNITGSTELSTLAFENCENITLNNIKINSTLLSSNKGVNLSAIKVINSNGLNHSPEFKSFILTWMKGGSKFVPTIQKTLQLDGIKWNNVSIKDIETILNFKTIVGGRCSIKGSITMQYKALNRSEITTLEEFKEKFANIEVNVPYASIFIDGPSTVVAGDNNTKNIKYKATVYPSDNELKDTLIKFDCVKLDESNPRNVTLEYYKGEDAQKHHNQYTEVLLITDETLEPSVDVEIITWLENVGGTGDSSNDRKDSQIVSVLKPTYPDSSLTYIVGDKTVKKVSDGRKHKYVINNLDSNGNKSTGTFNVVWSCDETSAGYEYVSIEEQGNDLYLIVNKDIPKNLNESSLPIKISAQIIPVNGESFEIDYNIHLLRSDVVISEATHPEIMNVLREYKSEWGQDKFSISLEEAQSFNDTDLYNLNLKFQNLQAKDPKQPISFREFKEFTGITCLPDYFFAGSDLSVIELPNSLTKIGDVTGINQYLGGTNGKHVFENCHKLVEVVFPNNEHFSEPSNEDNIGLAIPEYFCCNCQSLENIIIPERTVFIGDYVLGGTPIKTIKLPSTIQTLGKVFAVNDLGTNTMIEEITIPACCKKIDSVLYMANSLRQLNIEDDYVDGEGNAVVNRFYSVDEYGCLYGYNQDGGRILLRMPALNEVKDMIGNTITKFTFSDILEIGVDAFKNVLNLEEVELPGATWRTESGRTISSLSEKGEIIKSTDNYNGLFEGCINLKSVKLLENVINGAKITDRCFANCPNLVDIQLSEGFEYIGEYAFYNNAITEIILPKTIKKVAPLFISNCESLQNIVMSETIVSLSSPKDFLIKSLPSLESITLPYLFKDVPYSFIDDCPNLKEYILPDGLASYGFNESKNEDEIVIHVDEIEMNEWIENNPTYKQCNGYIANDGIIYTSDYSKLVKIPFGINDKNLVLKETIVEVAEGSCYKLTNVDHVILHDGITTIGIWSFRDSKNLSKVTLPNTLTKIGDYAFYRCEKLSSITFPENDITFGSFLFSETAITEIIIPDTVTTIGASAFYGLNHLTKLVFGLNVRRLESNSFASCPYLKTLVFKPMNAPALDAYAFPTDGRTSGIDATDKVMFIQSGATGYDSGEWRELHIEGVNTTKGWVPFELRYISLADMVSEISTYGLRKPNFTITTYNNGAQFVSQEMYLINTRTGEKFVGVVDGDHYVMPDLTKLYVGETYAVLISQDGLSYTFADLITFEFGKMNYEVDSVNGKNPYYDASAVAVTSMALDDMGVMNTPATPMVSKYEYDVLAAKVAYLESLINKL